MTHRIVKIKVPFRARVLVDVDDVLADFMKGSLSLPCWPKRHIEVTTWSIFDDLTPVECTEVFAAIGAPGFCFSLDVLPGAVAGIEDLRRVADVYFVTSPWDSPTWEYERKQWLWKHFRAMPREILQVRAKHLVNADILVDDKVSTVIEWKQEHPYGTAFLWGTERNASVCHCFKEQSLQRINSWDTVVEAVRFVPELSLSTL